MKIIKFALVLFCFGCFIGGAIAQTEQGSILLGGETNLSYSIMNNKWKTDNDHGNDGKVTQFGLSPQLGYFLIDGLVVGAEIPLSYSIYKEKDNDKFFSSSIAFAPFLKYYMGSSSIKPFLQGKVGFGTMKIKSEPATGTSVESKTGLFLYELKGGVVFFLNERVSLDIAIGYSYQSAKTKEDNPLNYKEILSGFGNSIGIVVIL